MDKASPYSATDKGRWRQAILDKGREVSTKLEEILAGKEITLNEISLFANDEPAETKEKRLRRFFDHLMLRLRVIEDPNFGFDTERDAFLSVAELDEMPWIECEPG